MYFDKDTKERRHKVLTNTASLHVPIGDLAEIFMRLEFQITAVRRFSCIIFSSYAAFPFLYGF